MSGFDEAVAWFRADPARVDEVTGGENLFMVTAAQRHAAVIVRRVVEHVAPADEPREDTGAVLRELRDDPRIPILAEALGDYEWSWRLAPGVLARLDAARSVSPDAAPVTTETSVEYRIPEREWQRREVMFLAREVVKYRDDPTTWSLKLDQLAAAFERLDTVSPWAPADDTAAPDRGDQ